VIIAEIIRRLESRGLETLTKCISVLDRDTDQITRSPNRAWSRFEQNEAVRIRFCICERRKLSAHLIVLAHAFPNGPNDMHHLPVRAPLTAGPLSLFALCSRHRLFHCAGDALFGADRDVRFHSTLPQSILA